MSNVGTLSLCRYSVERRYKTYIQVILTLSVTVDGTVPSWLQLIRPIHACQVEVLIQAHNQVIAYDPRQALTVLLMTVHLHRVYRHCK